MKRIYMKLMLSIAFTGITAAMFAQTTIDISTLGTISTSTALTTAGSPYTITGTNNNANTVANLFTVAAGQDVSVTFQDLQYKTINTAATKLIDCSTQSTNTVSIILKGTNVVDFQTVTTASTCINMAGTGTYNISEDATHGSLTMKIRDMSATVAMQTLGFNPTSSAANAKISVSGGTFTTEYTGASSYAKGYVFIAGNTGCWTGSITGGTFTTLYSGTGGSNSSPVLYFDNRSTATTADKTCTITGGSFTSAQGSAAYMPATSTNNFVFSGGEYHSGGTSSVKLFNNLSATGTMTIKAPSTSRLQINNNGTIVDPPLTAGTTDATAISSYVTSLILTKLDTPTGVNNTEVSTVCKSNGILMGLKEGDHVTVYSISGKTLLKAVATNSKMAIPEGLNIVKVTNNNEVLVLK